MSTTSTNLVAVPLPPARTTGVSAWVDIVKPAAALAEQIADTDFVPKAMRSNPAAITACFLFGAEIGIGPMQALAKIAIIEGRPAPSAELARALVLSDGHDMWVEEASITRVIMGGKRANSAHVQKVTWTMDDAKKAGLSGKQNWQRYPRQMLLARASIELARMIAPDSLGGISVFAEELDDSGPPDAGLLSGAPAGAAPAAPVQRRRLAAAPPPEPPLPNEAPLPEEAPQPAPAAPAEPASPPLPGEKEPPAALDLGPSTTEMAHRGPGAPLSKAEREEISTKPAPVEAPDGPSDAQIRKLMAIYNALGVRDRHDQKRISAQLLDLNALESHKDLTQAQMSILIDMTDALDPFQDIVKVGGVPYIVGSEPEGAEPPL